MFIYKGKTALVTGASSGIGRAFANALAKKGMAVVLVARSEAQLQKLAQEIMQIHGVSTEVIATDLAKEGAAAEVYREAQERGLNIDLLVNCAGFATQGYFEALDPEQEQQEVMVNTACVVGLSHAFLPPMLSRGGGAVINVASMMGFQPTPFMAVYGASKAFVLSFSEALSEEYRSRGVRVVALCPGPTQTSFFKTLGTDEAWSGPRRTPEQVAATGLKALERGRSVAVDGTTNAITALLPRFLPRPLVARIAGSFARPQETAQKAGQQASPLPQA